MSTTGTERFKLPPNDIFNKKPRSLSLPDLHEIAQGKIPEVGITIAHSVVSQFVVSGRGIARVNGIEEILIGFFHSQDMDRRIFSLPTPNIITKKFEGQKRALALIIGIDTEGNLLETYEQFYARVAKEAIQRLWGEEEGKSATEQQIINILKIIKRKGRDIKDIFKAIDVAVGIEKDKDEETFSKTVVFSRGGFRKPRDPLSLSVADKETKKKPKFEEFVSEHNKNLYGILICAVKAGIISKSRFENPLELQQVLKETSILASSLGAIRVKRLQKLIGIFLEQNPS